MAATFLGPDGAEARNTIAFVRFEVCVGFIFTIIIFLDLLILIVSIFGVRLFTLLGMAIAIDKRDM